LSLQRRNWITASVGTKHPAKDWGEENWDKLLGLLSQKIPDASLVLLGSADEWARSERLSRKFAGQSLNLCGTTSPRVSAAILERSRLFIGHDSGPMHLAAAVGTPTLGLFSWFNPPGQWFPGHRSWKFVKALYPTLTAGGWKPELQTKCGDSEGIRRLCVEDVFSSANELWHGISQVPASNMAGPLANTLVP
jgi:ADP-heptose:LPS heptosyltransferase